jgi:hypothetical protein
MGAIYEATDTRAGGRVAVKLVRREIAGSPSVEALFRREREVAASFSHFSRAEPPRPT